MRFRPARGGCAGASGPTLKKATVIPLAARRATPTRSEATDGRAAANVRIGTLCSIKRPVRFRPTLAMRPWSAGRPRRRGAWPQDGYRQLPCSWRPWRPRSTVSWQSKRHPVAQLGQSRVQGWLVVLDAGQQGIAGRGSPASGDQPQSDQYSQTTPCAKLCRDLVATRTGDGS